MGGARKLIACRLRSHAQLKMAIFKLLVALPILLLLSSQCHSKGVLYYQEPEGNMDGSCSGQPNTNKPWTGEPSFITKVTNGSLYTVGEGDTRIYGNFFCMSVFSKPMKYCFLVECESFCYFIILL